MPAPLKSASLRLHQPTLTHLRVERTLLGSIRVYLNSSTPPDPKKLKRECRRLERVLRIRWHDGPFLDDEDQAYYDATLRKRVQLYDTLTVLCLSGATVSTAAQLIIGGT